MGSQCQKGNNFFCFFKREMDSKWSCPGCNSNIKLDPKCLNQHQQRCAYFQSLQKEQKDNPSNTDQGEYVLVSSLWLTNFVKFFGIHGACSPESLHSLSSPASPSVCGGLSLFLSFLSLLSLSLSLSLFLFQSLSSLFILISFFSKRKTD